MTTNNYEGSVFTMTNEQIDAVFEEYDVRGKGVKCEFIWICEGDKGRMPMPDLFISCDTRQVIIIDRSRSNTKAQKKARDDFEKKMWKRLRNIKNQMRQ